MKSHLEQVTAQGRSIIGTAATVAIVSFLLSVQTGITALGIPGGIAMLIAAAALPQYLRDYRAWKRIACPPTSRKESRL